MDNIYNDNEITLNSKFLKENSIKNNSIAALHILIRIIFHFFLIYLSSSLFISGNYLIALLISLPHFLTFSFIGWAGIGHELSHNSVFSNVRVNEFFYRFFSILMWSNFEFFKISHWIHHSETLSENDIESNSKLGINLLDLFFLLTFDFRSCFNKLKILILNSLNIVPGKIGFSLFKKGSVSRKKIVKAAREILFFQTILISIFIYLRRYDLIILINLAPFTLTILNKIFAISQHFGVNDVFVNDYFQNSRTVILNKILCFFYANMNYHVEHHLYPNIPYYNLPIIHDKLKSKHFYSFYLIGFFELVKDLKKKGCFNLKFRK